jgi:hypothetical protein
MDPNKRARDARQQTFAIRSAMDMLRKLEWELAQLKANIGTEHAQYVAINVAMTAHHTLDWAVCEIDEKKRWDEVAKNLGITFAKDAGRKKRLRVLQAFARSNSDAMRHFEQIALAGKHRNITEFDEDVSTVVETIPGAILIDDDVLPNVVAKYERVVHYATRRSVNSAGGEDTMMKSIYLLGVEAHDWLLKFVDNCCLKQT